MKPIDWRRARHVGENMGLGLRTAVAQRDRKTIRYIELGFYGCRENLARELRWNLRVGLDVFDPRTRQPGVTYLRLPYDDYVMGLGFRPRHGCLEALNHALDCLVALPALLLNPDRYQGNWWKAEKPEELLVSKQELRYYGVDSTCIYHPALLSLILGLFRQAVGLHQAGFTKDLEAVAPRERVVDVLTEADGVRALPLVRQLRPWLEADGKGTYFPIGPGQWRFFLDLHRALYRHGFERVFGTIEDGWGINLGESGIYGEPLSGFRQYHTFRRARIASRTRRR